MNIRKPVLLLMVLVMLGFSLTSQNKNKEGYVGGEVLVQLKSHASLEKLLSKHQSKGLAYAELISERFNIYLLKFNESRTSNDALIKEIKNDKSVVNAQNNHYVSIRNTEESRPDDSLYFEQWSLENTGQYDGTPGADIDAINAWDMTTGGLTTHGDTIVVAIIDGGSDINHEDLNFWKNRAEIPNNGIDDDTNGFVDDYDGWNAYDHNGEIPIYNHGVHVTGIVAAKGDNHIGVSGVNWNLKIMPIAGSSTTESIVVESLSYVYVMRERYDNTDGEEGAFIVANNCSFGVDNGQPEDYPIWEAMYDSLGEIGVLSVGATANKEWDIDETGDVPTAFTTDFLITVTNTDRHDEKYASAGYGDTAIDLGAPGSYIMSTRANNRYGFSSGTSMSAPHVSGVVALMFAHADSTFMAEYKNQPDIYALLIKDYILIGADTIDDLVGKTVTGGRLNAFNSMILMGNPPEPKPKLSTNVDSVNHILLVDTSIEDTLILANTGNDTLFYSIVVEGQSEWLSISQDTGVVAIQGMDTIFMMFDAVPVDTGTYYDTLRITGPDIPVKRIPLKLHIYTDVGINETGLGSEKILVFPNPFSNEINIRFKDYYNKTATIEMFDQTGQGVYSNQFRVVNQSQKLNVDFKDSGVYYYQITIDNKRIKSGKLIRL